MGDPATVEVRAVVAADSRQDSGSMEYLISVTQTGMLRQEIHHPPVEEVQASVEFDSCVWNDEVLDLIGVQAIHPHPRPLD